MVSINFITWIAYEGMVYENALFSHIFWFILLAHMMFYS